MPSPCRHAAPLSASRLPSSARPPTWPPTASYCALPRPPGAAHLPLPHAPTPTHTAHFPHAGHTAFGRVLSCMGARRVWVRARVSILPPPIFLSTDCRHVIAWAKCPLTMDMWLCSRFHNQIHRSLQRIVSTSWRGRGDHEICTHVGRPSASGCSLMSWSYGILLCRANSHSLCVSSRVRPRMSAAWPMRCCDVDTPPTALFTGIER